MKADRRSNPPICRARAAGSMGRFVAPVLVALAAAPGLVPSPAAGQNVPLPQECRCGVAPPAVLVGTTQPYLVSFTSLCVDCEKEGALLPCAKTRSTSKIFKFFGNRLGSDLLGETCTQFGNTERCTVNLVAGTEVGMFRLDADVAISCANSECTAGPADGRAVTSDQARQTIAIVNAFSGNPGATVVRPLAGPPPPPRGRDLPEDAEFPYGLFDIRLTKPFLGGEDATGLTLTLPGPVTTYYKYGKTPEDPTDHWYEFLYDPDTLTGAQFVGNEVRLFFVDGERGDDDLVDNGVIVDVGGPVNLPEPDCNGNGRPDAEDLSEGSSEDIDANGEPDECQVRTVSCTLAGTAVGGGVMATIDGFSASCPVPAVVTAGGQSASTVVAHLAAAIDADACLAAQDITADAVGARLDVSGFELRSDDVTITISDAGLRLLAPITKVPTLSLAGLLALALLLALLGGARLRGAG